MQAAYSAHAHLVQHGNNKLAGAIHFDALGLHFKAEAAAACLPLDRLRMKLGGASNRLVFFEHPDHPDWVIFTSDRQVLTDPLIQAQPALRVLARQARAKRHRGWWLSAAVAALIIAAPIAAFSQMDRLTASIAPSIPAKWEQELGGGVFLQYKLSNSLLEDPEAKKELAALTEDLFQAAKNERYQFSVHINSDLALNAFALPDGTVVMNSGLILAADHADEVLGVLSHELSHVRHQHGMRQVIGGAGTYLIISGLVGDVSGILALLSDAAPLLLTQSYSRNFETEADREGAKLMTAIRADLNGLVRFFEKVQAGEDERLSQIGGKETQAALKASLGLLGTHPATEDRIAQLRKLSAQRFAVNATREAAFQRLKSRVAVLVTKSKIDESSSKQPQAKPLDKEAVE